jgi:DNA repair exonuclease SbcCD ATPase subunit
MIDLETLYLDGWLSYDKAKIQLDSRGVTLIKGNIGAGKSAVLEAIFYLLFGKTLRGKDSVNSLPNKILNNGYEIALNLKIDGVNYSIKEIRGRPEKGLYFYKNGEPYQSSTEDSAADPRKLILSTLGVSAHEFESIAFLGQKQSQILVEGTPGDRAKALVAIFGLNRYDASVKRCSELVKELAQKIEHQNGKVQQINDEVDNLKNMLRDTTEPNPEEIRKKKLKLKKVTEAVESTETKLSKLHELIEASKHTIGRAEALAIQSEKAATMQCEVDKLKTQLQEQDWPDATTTELELIVGELSQNRARYLAIVTQCVNEIESAKKSDNVCPINKKECPISVPRDSKKQVIADCNDRTKDAQKELKKIDKELEIAKRELKRAIEKEHLHYVTKSKLATIRTLRIEAVPDTNQAEAVLRKCRDAIGVGTEKIKELKEAQTALQIDIGTEAKAKDIKQRILNSIEEREKQLNLQKQKLEDFALESKYLAACISVLKKTKMYKIDLVLNLLNQYVNEILERVSDSEYKAQFVSQQSDAKGDRILDKIGIMVSDSYKTIPVELCSGGQRDEVGLSVLLATWKAAHNLSSKSVSSLWLDEAFGALDQEAIDRVFQSVVDVASELGAKAVKIISHRDLDSRLFDHTWEVKIQDGISSIKVN